MKINKKKQFFFGFFVIIFFFVNFFKLRACIKFFKIKSSCKKSVLPLPYALKIVLKFRFFKVFFSKFQVFSDFFWLKLSNSRYFQVKWQPCYHYRCKIKLSGMQTKFCTNHHKNIQTVVNLSGKILNILLC